MRKRKCHEEESEWKFIKSMLTRWQKWNDKTKEKKITLTSFEEQNRKTSKTTRSKWTTFVDSSFNRNKYSWVQSI